MTDDPDRLAAQTPLTKRQARVVVHRANGESTKSIADSLGEPPYAVERVIDRARHKALEADALLCHLPAGFCY